MESSVFLIKLVVKFVFYNYKKYFVNFNVWLVAFKIKHF